MLKFRKKPVVIEAFQMTKERRWNHSEWPEWLNAAWQMEKGEPGALSPDPQQEAPCLCISTLGGVYQVGWGDWIIQSVGGELSPCNPDIFEATYELVDEEGPPHG